MLTTASPSASGATVVVLPSHAARQRVPVGGATVSSPSAVRRLSCHATDDAILPATSRRSPGVRDPSPRSVGEMATGPFPRTGTATSRSIRRPFTVAYARSGPTDEMSEFGATSGSRAAIGSKPHSSGRPATKPHDRAESRMLPMLPGWGAVATTLFHPGRVVSVAVPSAPVVTVWVP